LRVDLNPRIGQVGSGQHRPLFNEKGFLAGYLFGLRVLNILIEDLASRGDSVFFGGSGVHRFIHQFELQKSRSADQILCSLPVFNAGKLYQNPFFTLDPNVRFANTELIDPISDRLQRLIRGQFFNTLGFLVRKIHQNRQCFIFSRS